MTFSAVLNEYMAGCGLSVTALSNASGLSKATISRFRSGKQEPSADSDTVMKLARGIAEASKSCWTPCEYEPVLEKLKEGLKNDPGDFAPIAANLNLLISLLSINVNDLSKHLKFDSSYLSRIRSGQRRPGNVPAFCEGVADFVSAKYSMTETDKLAETLRLPRSEITDIVRCRESLRRWISENTMTDESAVRPFLNKLDSFDRDKLNMLYSAASSGSVMEYGIPIAAQFNTSRDYFGEEGRKRAEYEWIKVTAISKSKEPVIVYSDFPKPESELAEKLENCLLRVISGGTKVTLVHNMDQSVYDMTSTLERMVPFYLSGMMESCYFNRKSDPVFRTLLWVSGGAGLSSEGVEGCLENGKTTLTTVKNEVEYLRRRGNDIISRTLPDLEIYPESKADSYMSEIFLPFGQKGGSLRSILPCPPLYTASSDLIKEICANNGMNKGDTMLVLQYAAQFRAKLTGVFASRSVEDIFPELTEEEFEAEGANLLLADLFMNRHLRYTYEQYTRHIEETKGFAAKNPNYCYSIAENRPFKNLCIRICSGENAVLSLNTVPVTHLVVRHPKLLRALENMTIPTAD